MTTDILAQPRRIALPPPWLLAGCLLAVLFTGSALRELAANAPARDFAAFHASGHAMAHGSWYAGTRPDRPNLNPPTFVLLTAPIMRLPLATALVLWSLLGAVSLAASLWTVARVLTLPAPWAVALPALLLCSFPARVAWSQGQVTWVLLFPLTMAWAAWRDGRRVVAGAWLAPAIALKPILALLPFALGIPTLLAAGAGSALLTGAAIGITGWQPWADWLAQAQGISWLAKPDNLSVWGVAARLALPRAGAMVLAGAVAGGLLWMAYRAKDADRRWWLGGVFTLALSPLGWAYYLPLWIGPLVGLLRAQPSRWLIAGVVGLSLPMSLWAGVPWMGSFYSACVCATLYRGGSVLAYVSPHDARRPPRSRMQSSAVDQWPAKHRPCSERITRWRRV